jgi:Ca-activated chloride channel family protein
MKSTVRSRILILLAATLTTLLGFRSADNCSIKGKVTDETGQGVISATVILTQNGKQVAAVSSDVDGNYCIAKIAAGTYDLEVNYIGYNVYNQKGVVVAAGTPTVANVKLTPKSQQLDAVVVTGSKYEKKLSKETVSIEVLSAKSITNISATTAGAFQASGKGAGVSGSRGKKQLANMGYFDASVPPAPVYDLDEKPDTKDKKKVEENTSEEYDRIVENEFLKPTDKPLSTFSIDVDVASYGIMRKKLEGQQMPPKESVRLEEMINYFAYNYTDPTDDKPFSVATEVGECPWNARHQLLHVGIQGKRMDKSALPPSNLVFLIDVSGSMSSADKLPLVKQSLRMLVKELRSDDRIAMVVYAGNSGLVLPSTPCSQKNKIIEALDRLEAGGSTAGAAGINQAYEVAKANFLPSGNNRVILCTDGDFNVGVSSDAELTSLIEKKREEGVFLSVLGFGMGNYKDSKMEKLADKGNGNYAYIDNEAEAKKNLVTQMGGTLLTIAKDVKLQVEFNPAKVKAYRLLGYENRALADKDFNDDKKDAGEIGAGVSVTALYEIITDENDAAFKEIPKTDPLKYQKVETGATAHGDEMLTVKIRYKEPKESTSKLLDYPVKAEIKKLPETSDNFRFAASVASFGMLLRDSKFKGSFTYDKVRELAVNSKGNDKEGYRAEFIDLIGKAKSLKNLAQK